MLSLFFFFLLYALSFACTTLGQTPTPNWDISFSSGVPVNQGSNQTMIPSLQNTNGLLSIVYDATRGNKVFKRSYSATASNDSLVISHSAPTTLTMSYCLWVNFEPAEPSSCITLIGANAGGISSTFLYTCWNGGTFSTIGLQNGPAFVENNQLPTLTPYTWYHICLTYNSNVVNANANGGTGILFIYINGQQTTYMHGANTPTYAFGQPLSVGGVSTSGGDWYSSNNIFAGLIDRPEAFYNTVLTAAQVYARYLSQLPTTTIFLSAGTVSTFSLVEPITFQTVSNTVANSVSFVNNGLLSVGINMTPTASGWGVGQGLAVSVEACTISVSAGCFFTITLVNPSNAAFVVSFATSSTFSTTQPYNYGFLVYGNLANRAVTWTTGGQATNNDNIPVQDGTSLQVLLLSTGAHWFVNGVEYSVPASNTIENPSLTTYYLVTQASSSSSIFVTGLGTASPPVATASPTTAVPTTAVPTTVPATLSPATPHADWDVSFASGQPVNVGFNQLMVPSVVNTTGLLSIVSDATRGNVLQRYHSGSISASTDSVLISNSAPTLLAYNMSYCLWVKFAPNEAPIPDTCVVLIGAASFNSWGTFLYSCWSGTFSVSIGLQNGQGYTENDVLPTMVPNTWYHICATFAYPGNTLVVYQNAQAYYNTTIATSPTSRGFTYPLSVGGFANTGGLYYSCCSVFVGQIDRPQAYYDRILTSTQVLALYNAPLGYIVPTAYTGNVSFTAFNINGQSCNGGVLETYTNIANGQCVNISSYSAQVFCQSSQMISVVSYRFPSCSTMVGAVLSYAGTQVYPISNGQSTCIQTGFYGYLQLVVVCDAFAPTTAPPPTTPPPTTIPPTTPPATTPVPTTTALSTTPLPTTTAPTTVYPTTVTPTTAHSTVTPTTVSPTTVSPTTVHSTSSTIAPTTATTTPTTTVPTTTVSPTSMPTTAPTNASLSLAPTTDSSSSSSSLPDWAEILLIAVGGAVVMFCAVLLLFWVMGWWSCHGYKRVPSKASTNQSIPGGHSLAATNAETQHAMMRTLYDLKHKR
jgi:hypothetical protein